MNGQTSQTPLMVDGKKVNDDLQDESSKRHDLQRQHSRRV